MRRSIVIRGAVDNGFRDSITDERLAFACTGVIVLCCVAAVEDLASVDAISDSRTGHSIEKSLGQGASEA